MAKQKSTPDQVANVVVKHENGALVVRVPVRFYRRNGRQLIVSPGDSSEPEPAAPNPNRKLVENLAKAYRWQEQLESGEYATLEELSKAAGVDRTYVSRILQLNSLSPSLVERILSGDEPSGLSMESLRNAISEVWARQAWV